MGASIAFFLESTFIDQNNPKRQTAGPRRGSPKLDLYEYCLARPIGYQKGKERGAGEVRGCAAGRQAGAKSVCMHCTELLGTHQRRCNLALDILKIGDTHCATEHQSPVQGKQGRSVGHNQLFLLPTRAAAERNKMRSEIVIVEFVRQGVGLSVGASVVGSDVGLRVLGLGVGLGVVGSSVVGTVVGTGVGITVVGMRVGFFEGVKEGLVDGAVEGAQDGSFDGANVGAGVDGNTDGSMDGCLEGCGVGSIPVGTSDGVSDGWLVEASDGSRDGTLVGNSVL